MLEYCDMITKGSDHEGVIQVRGKGTGFLSVEDSELDIVIPRESLNFALDGDMVKVTVVKSKSGEKPEGKVVEVLEPKHREFIGVVKEKDIDGQLRKYLSPDSRRIYLRPLLPEATADDLGMKVVVEIQEWKNPQSDNPMATITETLGKAGDHETEMQAILRSGNFSENFPPQVQQAAEELYKTKKSIFKEAIADPKRKDFRGVTTMTIDPVDAKDFDDALSLQTLENGNVEIGIHIADVSHYVREGDAIDKEAQERGTSVYLVDRVIPMLPEVLSNDLCSLRPHEDRLAFSAVFELNENGGVEREWYGQTIIHSDKRFSYEEAQDILDNGSGEFYDELTTMMELGRKLRKKRYQHGAIAFEQPEVKFELDENGKPLRAYAKHRTETMMMIEDFMLLANMRVAEFIYKLSKDRKKDLAFVYRIHDLPDPERIEELSIFLRALGYELKTKKGLVQAKDINALLEELDGKPEENLIKVATIRSMAKAVYSTKNIGHFGLAFKYYTHFTSPIRRYPDLMAHRLLRKHLDSAPISAKEYARYEKLSIQSSEREMEAVSAERDSVKYKQVEFMLDKVGQEFDAVISGVTQWGIFVEEKESKAEGLIPMAKLSGDYFEHDQATYQVVGQRTKKAFRLGDEIHVKLVAADLDERRLDFELVK